MNQKKIGTTLYVFSEAPYEITQDTDASVICIQEECIPGYAALNASLVSKFKAYNYHLFCVQKPEWADYYDDNIVVINPMTHGSVTASPMSADPGEEITLTVTPAENYELQTLTVLDGDDNPVTVTDNKFEMPEGNAYVSATFIGMEFDITVTAATNGTVSTSPANGARLGDTVTITMTPDQGYEVDTLTVTSGAATITVTNNQFTMPAGDVTVTGTFKSSAVPFEQQYFTIESLEDGNTLTLSSDVGGSYSTDDGTTWNTNSSGATINLDTGDKVIFKNTGNDFAMPGDGSFSDPIFGTTKTVNVYGNIMSLLYGDNFANQTSLPLPSSFMVYGNFLGLFYGCKVEDASNLILPATTLTTKCYQAMFYGCTSLTTAPELPATTLVESCYSEMFYNCSSLNYIKCLATDISASNCTNNWVSGVAHSGTFVKAALTSWTRGDSGIPSGWRMIPA